jgi:hypothetical protein
MALNTASSVWSQPWSQTTVNDGQQHVMRYRHEPGVSCVNDDGALRPRTFDNSRGEVESHAFSLAFHLLSGQRGRVTIASGHGLVTSRSPRATA